MFAQDLGAGLPPYVALAAPAGSSPAADNAAGTASGTAFPAAAAAAAGAWESVVLSSLPLCVFNAAAEDAAAAVAEAAVAPGEAGGVTRTPTVSF
jgi:hypothetical protein